MLVAYDDSLKIAGIGLLPWTRLGLERWFPNYAIASLYGWDLPHDGQLPRIVALEDTTSELPTLPKSNTQSLLQAKAFQDLLTAQLPGYNFITYKPIQVPDALRHRKFLMTRSELSLRYENKVQFRATFRDKLRFPPHAVYERYTLGKSVANYRRLMGARQVMIIQDEYLSGGKGTFTVKDYAGYCAALDALNSLTSNKYVVVSDAVRSPKERTIQACVTAYGTFVGPLQSQIVAHPLLANAALPGDKFCGAQIVPGDQGTPVHAEASRIARLIGGQLQQQGYRGIFGIDFLLDAAGSLFVLEVNPRVTGVTPLLTALHTAGENVPFYLLHALELGGHPYQIKDQAVRFNQCGSLLILHSLSPGPVRLQQAPTSGTYTIKNGELFKQSQSMRLADLDKGSFIVQAYPSKGRQLKPGGRLATIQMKEPMLDSNTDKLYNSTIDIIETVKKHVIIA